MTSRIHLLWEKLWPSSPSDALLYRAAVDEFFSLGEEACDFVVERVNERAIKPNLALSLCKHLPERSLLKVMKALVIMACDSGDRVCWEVVGISSKLDNEALGQLLTDIVDDVLERLKGEERFLERYDNLCTYCWLGAGTEVCEKVFRSSLHHPDQEVRDVASGCLAALYERAGR